MKLIRITLIWLCGVAFLVPGAAGMTLKIATAAPEGSKWMKDMRAGAEEISLRSEGRVRIKFFAGGVMGNDKSVLRKIRIGQLHGGAFIVGSLEEVVRDINIYSLPLIFRSYEEVDHVRSRMDGKLMNKLEEAGYACFGFAEGGFAFFMSPRPIRSVEDARGLKIWVPEGDHISYKAMNSIGLSPVMLPITDVMTGLQTRLIEVIASSPIGALAFQWHTKINYVTDVPLSYLYGTLVVDRRFFDRLRAEDRELVREVMSRIYADLDEFNRRDNQLAIEAMRQQGIEFIDVPKQESAEWREIAGDLNLRLARGDEFSLPLYEEMLGYLESFRQENREPAGR